MNPTMSPTNQSKRLANNLSENPQSFPETPTHVPFAKELPKPNPLLVGEETSMGVIQVAKAVDSVFWSLLVATRAEAEDFEGRRESRRSWYYTGLRYPSFKQRLQGLYLFFADVIAQNLPLHSVIKENHETCLFSSELEPSLLNEFSTPAESDSPGSQRLSWESSLTTLHVLRYNLGALDKELRGLTIQLNATTSINEEGDLGHIRVSVFGHQKRVHD